MSRPRTLGPTITFRLPIELHRLAEERAGLHDLTVNEWIASRITEALARQAEQDARPPDIYDRAKPAKRQVTPRWKASTKTP